MQLCKHYDIPLQISVSVLPAKPRWCASWAPVPDLSTIPRPNRGERPRLTTIRLLDYKSPSLTQDTPTRKSAHCCAAYLLAGDELSSATSSEQRLVPMPLGLAGSVANYNRIHRIGPDAAQYIQQGVSVRSNTTARCTRFGTHVNRHSRRFLGCPAASLPEGQPDKASTQRRKAEAEQALKSLEDSGRIGSEYGEVGS